ncbi:MAG: hypothetical protein WCL50_12835 [Spirochaetota bacterium]
MSKKASSALSAEFVLQICLGAFFLVLGIMGVTSYKSNLSGVLRFFGKNDTLNIVVAIAEIAMGAVLLIGLFAKVSGQIGQILGIVLALLWVIYLVMTYFVNKPFEPSFIEWLFKLSRDLVILVSLWIVGRRSLTD